MKINKNLIIPDSIEQVIGLIERDMLGNFDKIKFYDWKLSDNGIVTTFFVTSLIDVRGFNKDFIDDIICDCTPRNIELVNWAILDPYTLSPEYRNIEFVGNDVVIMLKFKELK